MLFNKLVDEYNFRPKGIVHLGAYKADELNEYNAVSPEFVVWAEANPFLWTNLDNIFLAEKRDGSDTKHLLYKAAITDKDDETVKFLIYNHDEASSLFDVGADLHKWYPEHKVQSKVQVDTVTVDTMLQRLHIDVDKVQYLSIDLQGAEILALKGAHNLLSSPNLQYIQSEVIFSSYYEDGADGNEIYNVLSEYGFEEVAVMGHEPLYTHIAEKIHSGELPTIDQYNVLFRRIKSV